MLWLLLGGGSVLLVWFFLAWSVTHPLRAPLFYGPYDLGLPYEEVEFPSRDGLKLSGWWIAHPEPSGVVVLCHGYMINRCEIAGAAHTLYRAGFSCLLFDFRAMGRSEGDMTTIGGREIQDALGAVDFVERFGLPVAIMGSSMGGAVAIMAAARDERIGAAVADCAYASLSLAADNWWISAFGWLPGNLCRPVKYLAALITGVSPSKVAPIREIARIAPRPVLLLYGERDTIAPAWHGRRLFEAAREPKTLWIAPDSGHVQARVDHPEDYYGQVVSFLRQWVEALPESRRNPT